MSRTAYRFTELQGWCSHQRLWNIAFPPGSSLRTCLHFHRLDADALQWDDWSTEDTWYTQGIGHSPWFFTTSFRPAPVLRSSTLRWSTRPRMLISRLLATQDARHYAPCKAKANQMEECCSEPKHPFHRMTFHPSSVRRPVQIPLLPSLQRVSLLAVCFLSAGDGDLTWTQPLRFLFLFWQIGWEDVSKDWCWDERHNPHDRCETNVTYISLRGGRGSLQTNRLKNTSWVLMQKKTLVSAGTKGKPCDSRLTSSTWSSEAVGISNWLLITRRVSTG